MYGGSFNPPHIAHAMVASWLVWSGEVDQVWIVPVYQHAFEKIMVSDWLPMQREFVGVD